MRYIINTKQFHPTPEWLENRQKRYRTTCSLFSLLPLPHTFFYMNLPKWLRDGKYERNTREMVLTLFADADNVATQHGDTRPPTSLSFPTSFMTCILLGGPKSQ